MEERLTVLQQGGIFGLMQGDFVSYSNGVYNVRKYINISTVFVAVIVFRFYIWERLLSAVATLSCL